MLLQTSVAVQGSNLSGVHHQQFTVQSTIYNLRYFPSISSMLTTGPCECSGACSLNQLGICWRLKSPCKFASRLFKTTPLRKEKRREEKKSSSSLFNLTIVRRSRTVWLKKTRSISELSLPLNCALTSMYFLSRKANVLFLPFPNNFFLQRLNRANGYPFKPSVVIWTIIFRLDSKSCDQAEVTLLPMQLTNTCMHMPWFLVHFKISGFLRFGGLPCVFQYHTNP